MKESDSQYESRFFAELRQYINLEKDTARDYPRESYSLDGVKKLAAAAGSPETDLRIIHIAGTKGKGSAAYFLAALLESADITCGVFTSPHLVTVRERFLINNVKISYTELLDAVADLKKTALSAGLHPTFFEFLTVLALLVFRRAGCSYAVIETGIGGLLDSTNYIENPVCSVITPISYDHTELLGKRIEQIAAQKAGIIKQNVPVVCGIQPFWEVIPVLKETAAKKDAAFHEVAKESLPDLDRWLSGYDLPLFQRENFQTALKVCDILNVTPCSSDFRLNIPCGRCECLRRDPLVIIDAAHNRDSAGRLVQAVRTLYPGRFFTVILGIAEGKDGEGILTELKGVARRFILTDPRPFKKSQLETLIELADKFQLDYRIIQNIESRAQLPPADNLLFTGSFFTAVIGKELFPG